MHKGGQGMNRCLCCGKLIRPTAISSKQENWHESCLKSFFGTKTLPNIDISNEVINQLAVLSTNKGFTIPGVQKKLSLHLSKQDEPRLTLVNYPTGYILKPQTDEYIALPELEYLIMSMAKKSGIKTVPFALVVIPSQNNAFAYITKRIDRDSNQILAMEDFCQLDGRLTEDKYRGSYERCGKIICRYSNQVNLDLTELFLRVVFSFVVGNSDMHLKNFSLIETYENSKKYVLSSAYDMLSTNIVIPSDQEQLALTINGKKQNINREDFFILANTIGITNKAAEKMIEKIIKLKDDYLDMINASYIPSDMKKSLANLIFVRTSILEK